MEVYGLTGGIGSGKSTVASMLEEYGIPVVSADELSRMVVAPGSPGLADVVNAFGPEVLDERGELDRKKMGKIVFATAERRRQLEAILHPRIRERYEQVLDALEKAGHPVMVYEVPLLFEKKLDQQDEMKAVILVAATADTRIARVKDRDALTTDDVLARMRTQMPEEEKRERADYVVHNDGDLDDLRREVEYLLSRFLRIPLRAEQRVHTGEDPLEVVEVLDAELEVVEVDEVLDEAEIDTLSPEEVANEPTSPISVASPEAAPSPSPSPSVDHLELSVTSEHAPGSAPVPTAAAGSVPQLEVELQPTTPIPTAGSHRSGSSWIPATPVAPQGASPAPAPAAPAAPAGGPTAASKRPSPSPAPPVIPAPTSGTTRDQDSSARPVAATRSGRPRASTSPQLSAPDIAKALNPDLLGERSGHNAGNDEEPT
ncbi:Dephospho-CoA kinase [Enhygromyxa salina]|uniref:Dephospho-CoA kinase n=1 Tax=Enhygromyxa salina TaxID=215803 RepID=A0A0C2CYG0_9BACT|nr:dephospho-CoA kinase [Enhygromyxa salina]KIG14680.1 Dephospho-CoA kinase [Enhygromyxa salina]